MVRWGSTELGRCLGGQEHIFLQRPQSSTLGSFQPPVTSALEGPNAFGHCGDLHTQTRIHIIKIDLGKESDGRVKCALPPPSPPPPADHSVPELRASVILSLLEINMKASFTHHGPPSQWKIVGEGHRSQLPILALEAF